MWTSNSSASLERVPTCAGVYAIRSKNSGRVVFVGLAEDDLRRSIRASFDAIGSAAHRAIGPGAMSRSEQIGTARFDFLKSGREGEEYEYTFVARGADLPLLDLDAVADALIAQLRPACNQPGSKKRAPRLMHPGFALDRCPCCGRPW